jgi:hypothetical protein
MTPERGSSNVGRDGVLVFAMAAALAGAWAGTRGLRLLALGRPAVRRRPPGSLWVVRGLRGIIVWVCLTGLGIGMVFEQVWLLVFAGCGWPRRSPVPLPGRAS